MKIYTISGLGADQSVYKELQLKQPLIPIDWIPPRNKESFSSYVRRLSKAIDTKEEFGLMGVSFGGLIAIEIGQFLQPKFTILISSVETKDEFPLLYRWIGKSKLVSLLPLFLLRPPRSLAAYLFGAKNKKLLYQILDDTNLKFAKWAILQLLNWKNTVPPRNIIRLHGQNDRLLPIPKKDHIIPIVDGTHFMIVDRAFEISSIINEEIIKRSIH